MIAILLSNINATEIDILANTIPDVHLFFFFWKEAGVFLCLRKRRGYICWCACFEEIILKNRALPPIYQSAWKMPCSSGRHETWSQAHSLAYLQYWVNQSHLSRNNPSRRKQLSEGLNTINWKQLEIKGWTNFSSFPLGYHPV